MAFCFFGAGDNRPISKILNTHCTVGKNHKAIYLFKQILYTFAQRTGAQFHSFSHG
jgi:hypothetical protein